MITENKLHIPMRSSTKRVIFFSLLFIFAIYSFFIAGSITEYTRGNSALTKEAKQGKLVFQKYNCIACHQVYGLGGYLGPDLTNVASAPGKGKEYVYSLLKYGTTRMPDFHLSENEITDLMSYLNYLDKTGKSPVRDFTLSINGTYSSMDEK